MSSYEIEIKSLLGNKENAELLRSGVVKKGGKLLHTNRQLNHYFIVNDPKFFETSLTSFVPENKRVLFKKVLEDGNNISVRTRDTDGKVLLVVKASVGDDTSANGVSRMEFESEMPMSLDELDKLLLGAGLEYQAKWSREREEYELKDAHICLDRNAGYGYVAEFEKISDDASKVDSIKKEIYDLMAEFGVTELPQDRLERMFAHYNANWRDYYGTENIFNIE